MKRLIIAGTNSGCGKTTISIGIMAALKKKGLKVQPYKVGPDYIDPMFHTFVTNRQSRNLDSWMLTHKTILHLFSKNYKDADIAIIEGVMGFFDGLGGTKIEGSTAHVATITKTPVILIVNGEGISLSLTALIQGFKNYDSKDWGIKGVIINNIKSHSHYKLLKKTIEEKTGILVVGYLEKSYDIGFESRHLGLVMANEIPELSKKIDILSDKLLKTIDFELLIKISEECDVIEKEPLKLNDMKYSEVKIAVAKDEAFNFYYKDNLDLLESLGAKLYYFSPLKDNALPEGIQGLYIGGGYPEVFAGELEANISMRQDISQQINKGLTAYAECGGLMYMCSEIKTLDNREFNMVGMIPGTSIMTTSLKRFGYVNVEFINDCSISKKGENIRAHEFHYSEIIEKIPIEKCYKVSKTTRAREWECGYRAKNLIAGYPHLHFWANYKIAEKFIYMCRGD